MSQAAIKFLSVWVVGCALVACGDDSGGKSPTKDAGGGNLDAALDSSSAGLACGTASCEVSEADLAWGAEACCVDSEKSLCGVKSSKPVVMTPDGSVLSVGEALIQLISIAPGDAGVVNTMPTLGCVPKDAPGTPSSTCPSETFDLTEALGDGGTDDAGAAQTYTVPACCRDDGMCGYEDQATGLGCVKISQSFLGQVLGRKDQSCTQ